MARSTLVLVVLALALAAPSSASAAWLPIEDVGDIGQSDVEMLTAANDRGDAVVAWTDDRDSRGIQVAVSRRGRAFGPARMVPGTANRQLWDVRVLLNEDGRALITWRVFNTANSTNRVYLVGLKVDGGFGTTRPVTPSAPYVSFFPAIGPGGRFAFAYSAGQTLKPVYVRTAPPSGKLGPRRTLATGELTVRDVWYVGTRPYLAFTRRSADDDTKLFERRLDPLGSARVIAKMPRFPGLWLDTASNGTQVAVWTGERRERPDVPLIAAVRRAGGTFRGQEIDRRYPPQGLDVAVARSGAALVVWNDFYEATTEDTPAPEGQERPGRIITSYRAPGRSFGATRAFRPIPETADVGIPNVDIASDGMAVLGYGAIRYAGIEGRPYVAIADRGGEPQQTPLGDDDGNTGFPFVAIDERARTLAVLVDDGRVRAMRGDFGR